MPRPKSRAASPAPALSSRPPLQRMQVLHERLQFGSFPNCRKLSEELEISPKTIQRDIDFMRDQLGYPIAYDNLRRGFYYREPVSTFPGLEVSAGELVAVFVAQKALRQFRGTAFANRLAVAFRRLTESLQDRVTFAWSDLDESISFQKVGTSATDLQVFEEVSRAVVDSRELGFDYRKLQGPKFERRRLQPYHLGSIENQWYVIGRDLDRQALRTFALSRMRRPKMAKGRFQRPAEFSIEKHLHQSFGVFAGGPNLYTVRVHFEGVAAELVGEREWHPSQQIRNIGPGRIEFSLQLCSLREIERWILSWGANARAIEPPELVERLRKSAQALARNHGG